jgi:hypothetical protein
MIIFSFFGSKPGPQGQVFRAGTDFTPMLHKKDGKRLEKH